MKIFCIGRNYKEHAQELGNDVPKKPVVFMKPQTALLKNNDPFYYPAFSEDMHYECEVVLRIAKGGKHIAQEFAYKYVDAYSLGIDFTARDVQEEQKQKGLPWEIAKAFDNSAVISNIWHPLSKEDFNAPINFSLKQNSDLVQVGDTSNVIFSFSHIVHYVSTIFTLQQGDLIYTGTPKGVGPIAIGDKLEGFIKDQLMFAFEIK